MVGFHFQHSRQFTQSSRLPTDWIELKSYLLNFDSKQSLAGSDCWSNRMHVEGEEVQRQQPPRESSLLILHFNQIHFSIWTNTFGYLDKYILKFGQIHFETWTREYKCRGNSCTGKAASSIQTFPNSCHTFSLSCNKKYKAQFHNFKKYTMQFNQHWDGLFMSVITTWRSTNKMYEAWNEHGMIIPTNCEAWTGQNRGFSLFFHSPAWTMDNRTLGLFYLFKGQNMTQTNVRINIRIEYCMNIQIVFTHSRTKVQIYSFKQNWHGRLNIFV